MPTQVGKFDDMAHDKTGVKLLSKPKAEGVNPWRTMKLMKNPALFRCPECGGEDWRIFADDAEGEDLVCFRCKRCDALVPPMEMHVPQMSDERARRLGVWVPKVEFDIVTRR